MSLNKKFTVVHLSLNAGVCDVCHGAVVRSRLCFSIFPSQALTQYFYSLELGHHVCSHEDHHKETTTLGHLQKHDIFPRLGFYRFLVPTIFVFIDLTN